MAKDKELTAAEKSEAVQEVAMNEKDNAIEEVFKNYPYAEEVYETSDGSRFVQKDYAQAHAASLSKKGITTYKHQDYK